MSVKTGYLSNICLCAIYLHIFFISNNLAVGIYCDNGGIRRMSANSISYTWTVDSNSLNNLNPGQNLNHFVFFEKDNHKYQWRLDLYPKGRNYNNADWMSLVLVSQNEMNVTAHCRFSIMDGNGRDTNSHFYTYTFLKSQGRGWDHFVLQSDLRDKTKNLLPDGQLTIYGEIILIDETSTDSSHCRFPSNVPDSENTAIQLLNEGILSDVQLLVGGQIINAHRAILAAQSWWFLDQFTKNPKLDSVRMENTTMATAWQAVRFMYIGKIEFDNSMAAEMLALANQFGIPKLKLLCEEILCKTRKPTKSPDIKMPRVTKISKILE